MKKEIIEEKMYSLKDLPKGEVFKTTPTARIVWVRDEYDRSEKKYCCYAWDDVNYFRMFDGKKQVYAGFIF